MPNRPDQDLGRQPTLIDPMAAVTERLVLPGDGSAGPDDPVVVVGHRYEVRELLASGGMCDVWRAHDPVLDREVAVKQLLPRWREEERVRERFASEALRVAKLSHPAIVGVLDAGEDAAGPFLVMELIDGPSLDQRLAAEGRLSVDEAADVGKAVARGLAAAHRAGIVHRDVKPGNILLDSRHGARLTDFGIAKATVDMDLTATGEIIGTAAYLSPEQAMGLPLDHRSDIYALGCVLFECLTGQRPFGGDTPVQTASARIGVQVRISGRVAGIPGVLEDVVTRAMAPEPADRWPDGDAMASALVAAKAHRSERAVTATPDVVMPRRPRPTTPAEGVPARRISQGHGGDATGDLQGPAAAGTGGATSAAGQASTTAALHGPRHGADALPAQDRQPGVGPGDGRPVPGATTAPGSRRGTLVTVGLAMAGIVIAGALALTAAGDDSDQAAAAGAESTGVDDSTAAAPLTELTLASFDPLGGDGENDEDLPRLTDGDHATRWTTVGYNTAAFGNLKTGVGVLVDLGSEVAVTEVRLFGMPEGQSVELRVADAQPSQVADTRVVAQARGLGTEAALRADTATRFLVVWLVPDLPADGGRFRGGFGEIEVFGG